MTRTHCCAFVLSGVMRIGAVTCLPTGGNAGGGGVLLPYTGANTSPYVMSMRLK